MKPNRANPILAEVIRGNMVESAHRGALAVMDASGKVIFSLGDIGRHIYPRSALKPLQAISLLESGAADQFNLDDRHIALACASHNGEPAHVDLVREWLQKLQLEDDDLECGPQVPVDRKSADEMVLKQQVVSRLHNNCSGKHSGFLSTARYFDEPVRGYTSLEHPVQQRLLQLLQELGEVDLTDTARGIDGCGIPVIGVPLRSMALALAKMANPGSMAGKRQLACERILAAMAAQPFFVAGSGRFCTEAMSITGKRALVKVGAEAVYAGIFPDLGFGVAIKIDDGTTRAAEVVMGLLISRLVSLSDGEKLSLGNQLVQAIENRAGVVVGECRPVAASFVDLIRY